MWDSATVLKPGATAEIQCVSNRNRSEAQLDDLKFQSGVKWVPIDANAKNRISQIFERGTNKAVQATDDEANRKG
jgi:hypothetical protein